MRVCLGRGIDNRSALAYIVLLWPGAKEEKRGKDISEGGGIPNSSVPLAYVTALTSNEETPIAHRKRKKIETKHSQLFKRTSVFFKPRFISRFASQT